jgi:sarcosine oxidase subunit gamma
MAEPVRTSPLAGLALAERSVSGAEPVTLAAMPFRGKLILRGGDAIRERAARVLGTTLPPALRSVTTADTVLLWLGPDEWLILTAADRAEAMAAALRDALAGLHHAVVVVGDRMTGIRLAGARAADVLNAGCPLDLHLAVFPAGAVTRTVLAKATVVLRRPEEAPAFELWVNGSFAPYAWRFLENAAREFGIAIAA